MKWLAASVLLVASMLAPACSSPPAQPQVQPASTSVLIRVDGMTWNECANRVRSALAALQGVSAVDVIRRSNMAVVAFDEAVVKPEQLSDAIRRAGFRAGTPVRR